MAIAGEMLTEALIKQRLSEAVYERYFNDHQTGAIDEDTVNSFISTAERRVKMYLPPNYAYDPDSPAPELVDLALEMFEALVAERHPEIRQIDVEAKFRRIKADLKGLADGDTSLQDLDREDDLPSLSSSDDDEQVLL